VQKAARRQLSLSQLQEKLRLAQWLSAQTSCPLTLQLSPDKMPVKE
jgi:hypothetical protein